MNILFFTENFPPEVNAAASRVFERACYWVQLGHKVTIVTCAPNFPQGKIYPGYQNKWFHKEVMTGIEVIRVKTFVAKNEGIILRTLDFVSYFLSATPVALSLPKPDLIVATSPQFFAAIAGWLVAALKKVPFILELSDLWPASITAVGVMKDNLALRCLEKLELFLYRQATAIITLTNYIKEDLIKRKVPKEKISVIINGVDLSKFSPRDKDKELIKQYNLENKFIVGYIGTHGLAHNLENVLTVAQNLKNHPDIVFMFVGEGAAKEKLMQQAKMMQLQNVLFLPAYPKEQIANLWSLCDLALVHLKNTPLFAGVIPSKIFEAMGMGLPILLVAPDGEATSIIRQSGAGSCVVPDDPEELMQIILDYKNSPDKCKSIAAASYQAANSYTRERQALDFLGVLTSIYNKFVGTADNQPRIQHE